MTTQYSVIRDPATGQSFNVRSKNGTLLIHKLVKQVGAGKRGSKKKWSSYECKKGKPGVKGIIITESNCNKQISHGSSKSRCKLNKLGHCRKAQNASKKRGQRNWSKTRSLLTPIRQQYKKTNPSKNWPGFQTDVRKFIQLKQTETEVGKISKKQIQTLLSLNLDDYDRKSNPLEIVFSQNIPLTLSSFNHTLKPHFNLKKKLAGGAFGDVYITHDGTHVVKTNRDKEETGRYQHVLDLSEINAILLEMVYHKILAKLKLGPALPPKPFFIAENKSREEMKYFIAMNKYDCDLHDYAYTLSQNIHKNTRAVSTAVKLLNHKLKYIVHAVVKLGIFCTDIKPGNILVNYNSKTLEPLDVVLTDFGAEYCCNIVKSREFGISLCETVKNNIGLYRPYIRLMFFIILAMEIQNTFPQLKILKSVFQNTYRTFSSPQKLKTFHKNIKILCVKTNRTVCDNFFPIDYYLRPIMKNVDSKNKSHYSILRYRFSDMIWNCILFLTDRPTLPFRK